VVQGKQEDTTGLSAERVAGHGGPDKTVECATSKEWAAEDDGHGDRCSGKATVGRRRKRRESVGSRGQKYGVGAAQVRCECRRCRSAGLCGANSGWQQRCNGRPLPDSCLVSQNSTRKELPMPCLMQDDSMLRPVRYYCCSKVRVSERQLARLDSVAMPNEGRQPSETVCSHQRPPTDMSSIRALIPSTTPAASHPSQTSRTNYVLTSKPSPLSSSLRSPRHGSSYSRSWQPACQPVPYFHVADPSHYDFVQQRAHANNAKDAVDVIWLKPRFLNPY
jgi:hypothetical protein